MGWAPVFDFCVSMLSIFERGGSEAKRCCLCFLPEDVEMSHMELSAHQLEAAGLAARCADTR